MSLAFLFRTAIAAVLYAGSLSAGRGGFITGDDIEYAYLFGTYVYLESAVFFVSGRRAEIESGR